MVGCYFRGTVSVKAQPLAAKELTRAHFQLQQPRTSNLNLNRTLNSQSSCITTKNEEPFYSHTSAVKKDLPCETSATRGPTRLSADLLIAYSVTDSAKPPGLRDDQVRPQYNTFTDGYTYETNVMNQPQTTGWSPLVSGPDEDFANFLEFGDLQLDFSPFDGISQNGGHMQQDSDVAMDTPMGTAPEMPGYDEAQVSHPLNHSTSNPLFNGYGGHQGHLFDMRIPTEHLNQQPHVYAKGGPQYTQGMVPPTPNSIEMHGGHPGYYQMAVHQQAHMYEHYQRNQRDKVRKNTLKCHIQCS